ncbi:MAG: N-acetylmuramoyl-L-alanine amidase [Lachnospiraceae bacterium]|nr:N-acetylmuramoyl-L-alanine amidase [Lachnospiraceae bacterium]
MKKTAAIILAFIVLMTSFPSYAAGRIQTYGDELVIVIDPGHGGSNEGTDVYLPLEKERTLVTAKAMAAELERYANIKVYLTRDGDKELSLKERAEFAASVQADFIFSIHYNASEEHDVFGTEIWIPARAPLHAMGYQFADLWMQEMQGMGLHPRGIKTRLNDKGTDYYGIIREATAKAIPAVILEHCHLDAPQDRPWCDEEEDMKAFGRADATAVAKYFGLMSNNGDIDYVSWPLAEIHPDEVWVFPLGESSEPESCELELVALDEESGEAEFEVMAEDSDELLQYFAYSLDGGESYSPPEVWPGYAPNHTENAESTSFKLTLPKGRDTEVKVRVYNRYDRKTESETVSVSLNAPEPVVSVSESDADRARQDAALAWEGTHDIQERLDRIREGEEEKAEEESKDPAASEEVSADSAPSSGVTPTAAPSPVSEAAPPQQQEEADKSMLMPVLGASLLLLCAMLFTGYVLTHGKRR